MFGHRYFGAAYFGPRYWGDGGTDTPVVTTDDIRRIFYGLGPHPKQNVHPHPVFTTRH